MQIENAANRHVPRVNALPRACTEGSGNEEMLVVRQTRDRLDARPLLAVATRQIVAQRRVREPACAGTDPGPCFDAPGDLSAKLGPARSSPQARSSMSPAGRSRTAFGPEYRVFTRAGRALAGAPSPERGRGSAQDVWRVRSSDSRPPPVRCGTEASRGGSGFAEATEAPEPAVQISWWAPVRAAAGSPLTPSTSPSKSREKTQ